MSSFKTQSKHHRVFIAMLKICARQNLGPTSLSELIDLIGNIALAKSKQGGQLYTPRSIVELLVNMLVGGSISFTHLSAYL